VSCKAAQIIDRQLAYNTDPGTPATDPGGQGKFGQGKFGQGKFYSEYLMVLEPEQDRYTATLTLSYTDPSRPQDFPILAVTAPLSTGLRPRANRTESGHRFDTEDYRFGFNSDITEAKVDYLRREENLDYDGL